MTVLTSEQLLCLFASALIFSPLGLGCELTPSEDAEDAMMDMAGAQDMPVITTVPDGMVDMGIMSDEGTGVDASEGSDADMTMPVTPRDFAWNGGERVVDVQAGRNFACALFDQGGVKCWGENSNGIRGAMAFDTQEQPTVFPGYGSGVESLYVGGDHACVKLMDGAVECWGGNISAQLTGVPNIAQGSVPNPTPLRVDGLGEVTKIVGGLSHTCALREDSRVLCWGSSVKGAIGHDEKALTGSSDAYETPTFVQGFNGKVLDIEPHANGTCALIDTGEVECWGGSLGALSDNAYALRAPGLAVDVTKVFGGSTSQSICALRDGVAVCLGSNRSGQFGLGDRDARWAALPALDLPNEEVLDIAPGEVSTCWLMSSGEVYCAGNNDRGQLGNGSTEFSVFPVEVEGLTGKAVQITAGEGFFCARMEDAGVMCWGDGDMLGDDESGDDRDEAVAVAGLDTTTLTPGYMDNPEPFDPGTISEPSIKDDPLAWLGGQKVVSISSGESHSCALYDEGGVRCWGDAGSKVLGESVVVVAPPVEIPDLGQGVVAINMGDRASCVLVEDEVQCWGSNFGGQLGQEISGSDTGRPRRVPLLGSGMVDVHLGPGFGCALYADNVKCWGDNNEGKVGIGSEDSSVPARATDMNFTGPVKTIASSSRLRFALLEDGSVQSWGPEAIGGASLSPRAVPGISSATALAVGDSHWCVIEAGAVRCAGRNQSGQLGDGTLTTSFDVPVSAVGLSGTPSLLACGDEFTCVAMTEGGVQCAGRDVREGNSNLDWQAVPGLHEDATLIELTATSYFACALFDDGRVQCWGENKSDELGALNDGTTSYSARDVYGL